MTDERLVGYDLQAIFDAAPKPNPVPLDGKYWPEGTRKPVIIGSAYEFGKAGFSSTDNRLISTWGENAVDDFRRGIEDRRALQELRIQTSTPSEITLIDNLGPVVPIQ